MNRRQQSRKREIKRAYIPKNKQRSVTRRRSANNAPKPLSPNSQPIETTLQKIESALLTLHETMSTFVTKQELQKNVSELKQLISENERDARHLFAQKEVDRLNEGIKQLDKKSHSAESLNSSDSHLFRTVKDHR